MNALTECAAFTAGAPAAVAGGSAAVDTAERWGRAMHAAALLAIEPAALGGVWLKAGVGPVRERWLALLDALLSDDTPRRRGPRPAR